MNALPQPVPNMGGCPPVLDTVVEEPTWGETLTACAPSAMGNACGSGDRSCVRPAPASFDVGYCIYQAGDVPCPAGDYATRLVRYTAFADSRSCDVDSCTCGAPDFTCATSVDIVQYTAPCTSGTNLTDPTVCEAVVLEPQGAENFNGLSYRVVHEPITNAQCPPSEAAAAGELAAADPVTYCCVDPTSP